MSVIANPTLTGNELDLARLQVGDGHYRAPYTRKNLLDNWYFVGGGDQQGGGQFPINSKKQTSYSSGIYTIDRWRINGNNTANFIVSISSNFLSLSNNAATSSNWINQIFENELPIGTYTFSVLIKEISGTVRAGLLNASNRFVYGGSNLSAGLNSFTWNATQNNAKKLAILALTGATASIIAAKLELGSEQTLAHLENGIWVLNENPDYTTQLLRCQRFFRVFTSTTTSTTGYGYSTNPKNLRPEMRATPSTGSFTYGGTTYYYLNANL